MQNAITQFSLAGRGLVDLTTNDGISTAGMLASNIILTLESGFTLQGTTCLSSDRMVASPASDNGIYMTNTKISNGSACSITNGELQLGTNS